LRLFSVTIFFELVFYFVLLFPVGSAIADGIPMVQIFNQIGGFGKI